MILTVTKTMAHHAQNQKKQAINVKYKTCKWTFLLLGSTLVIYFAQNNIINHAKEMWLVEFHLF